MKKLLLFYFSFIFLLFLSCKDNAPTATGEGLDAAQLREEVEAAVWAFHAADTSRDAEAVIDLLWPECTMLVDGNQYSYDQLSSGARQFMSSLAVFETQWTNLMVIPVAENAAIASFTFRDSIVNKAGELTLSKGPNTFLWQKRSGVWKVLYGDADHYPVE